MTPDPESAALAVQARDLTIANDEQYGFAAALLKDVKAMQKKVEATFKPMKQAADKAKQEILDQERSHMGPLKAAEDALKAKSLDYTIARDAALQRQREEAQRVAEKAAEEARAAEAKRLWAEGNRKAAQEVKNAPLVVAPPAPVAEPAKIAGISTRPDFDFEITDKALVPMAFLMVDEVKVRKLVKQLGHEAGPLLPGIKIVVKQVMSVRG